MNGASTGDWAKIRRIPKTRRIVTIGIIHQSLRRQRKASSSPAIPSRSAVLRIMLMTALRRLVERVDERRQHGRLRKEHEDAEQQEHDDHRDHPPALLVPH